MKFSITFKDPDVVHDAIREAIIADVAKLDGLSEDERESVAEGRQERVADQCGKWIKWGEYVTIEIDTEANTCTVTPAGK